MGPGVLVIPHTGSVLLLVMGYRGQPSGRDTHKGSRASGIENRKNWKTPKGDFFIKENRLLVWDWRIFLSLQKSQVSWP